MLISNSSSIKTRNMLRLLLTANLLFLGMLAGTAQPWQPITNLAAADQAIAAGEFAKAQDLIAQYITTNELPDTTVLRLRLQSAMLDRIQLDFNRDEAYVRRTLAPYYPALSDEQLQAWEQSGKLEMRVIEGEKRYFRNAVWNLFRIDPAVKAKREAVDGPRTDELGDFLSDYLPPTVAEIKSGERHLHPTPKNIRIRYTLRVKPDMVPAGEIVRAWLPFPRDSRFRLQGIVLDSCSEDHFVLSPLHYPHRSLYLEKAATAGEWTTFSYQARYQAYDEWHPLLDKAVLPYDTSTEFYRQYTSEREQHIRFTPAIRSLADSLTAGISDPVEKAWRIYQWMGAQIPWTSALEYSTMPNIPAYCLGNGRGDCGMKALTFITLCRYAGIPAKWQSGWYLYPDNINLHDWSELYFEGMGWVPVDPDFNLQPIEGKDARRFFFGGADAYRFIVNDDFSGDFFPAKIYPRSETVDFQRGEVEWQGGNLYFNQWRYKMEVTYE